MKTARIWFATKFGSMTITAIRPHLDFALACRDCNFVLHPGAALEVGFRQEATGKGSIVQRGSQVIEHLSTVNRISVNEAQWILGQALKLHRERSRHKEWQIVIPRHMIEKYASLEGLTL
jgi:hypothetical protein